MMMPSAQPEPEPFQPVPIQPEPFQPEPFQPEPFQPEPLPVQQEEEDPQPIFEVEQVFQQQQERIQIETPAVFPQRLDVPFLPPPVEEAPLEQFAVDAPFDLPPQHVIMLH